MGIIFAILIFSFIVFFHELGHFTLAKLNGIDVQEFAIGMGPTMKRQSHLETSIKNLYGQEFQSLQRDRFLTLLWHLFSL